MTEPFLILHKVRGEPAFDIAVKLEVGNPHPDWEAEEGEEIWIIPTSGHRAYPARYWKLEDLADISDINGYGHHPTPWAMDDLPDDLRDHYEYQPEPIVRPEARHKAILQRLGLAKVPTTGLRRL